MLPSCRMVLSKGFDQISEAITEEHIERGSPVGTKDFVRYIPSTLKSNSKPFGKITIGVCNRQL